MVEACDTVAKFQHAMICGTQLGAFENLDFCFEPEADAEFALTAASAFGDDAVFAGFDVNGRRVAGAFHIEEKQQVFEAEGPARNHHRLAFAHPQK